MHMRTSVCLPSYPALTPVCKLLPGKTKMNAALFLFTIVVKMFISIIYLYIYICMLSSYMCDTKVM